MSGNLPIWLDRWLGIASEAGEGASWGLQSAWFLPPWMSVLLATGVVVLIIGVYLREGNQATRRRKLLLASARLAVLAVLLFMLAQVAIVVQRTGLPYVAVVLDDSRSMSIVDQYDTKTAAAIRDRLASGDISQASRWNLARALLAEHDNQLLRTLAERYRLRLYYLTGQHPGDAETVEDLAGQLGNAQPLGESTRLGTAVRNVLSDLRGSPPAAIVLLSDGINTDGPSLADGALYARRKGVPLYSVGLGDPAAQRDLRLVDVTVDEVVFSGDTVDFLATLSGAGFEGRAVDVVLRRADQEKPLVKAEATVGRDGQSQQVRLAYRPTEIGQFRYLVEIAPQEGEIQVENNRLERTVEVRNEKIRVLLAQATPSFEFRYLRNLLQRDETIELRTVLQETDMEHARQDRAALPVFPVRRDELLAYDVLILGDVNPSLLGEAALQNVAEFVSRPGKGGSLVLIAGPKYMPAAYRATPLAAVLPIDLSASTSSAATAEGGFQVVPTELGMATPTMQLGETPTESEAIWRRLPPLYWIVEASELKPGARVLAECPRQAAPDGATLPVIVMQYFGAGRVLMHLTDETWRWRRRVGDPYFAHYWLQMIRYLARTKLAGDQGAELTADRREYRLGDSVRLRLRFIDERKAPTEDDGATVVVQQPGQKVSQVSLRRVGVARGLFEGSLPSLPPGAYHAWLAAPTLEGRAPSVDFSVAAPAGEFERTQADIAALEQAAQTTKGASYTFLTADRLANDLPEGRPVPIESLPPRPLWNRWPVLATLVGLLVVEWLLRKRSGMA